MESPCESGIEPPGSISHGVSLDIFISFSSNVCLVLYFSALVSSECHNWATVTQSCDLMIINCYFYNLSDLGILVMLAHKSLKELHSAS